jgi:Calpain family cysteine protease
MKVPNWFSGCKSSKSSRAPVALSAARRMPSLAKSRQRPSLEVLEDRRLMSATVSLSNGYLTVTPDPSLPSHSITLDTNGTQTLVTLDGQVYSENATAGVTINGAPHPETVTIKHTLASVPMTVFGGVGNDTFDVLGNSGSLTIDGRGGKDLVNVGSNAPANGTLATIQGQVSVANAGGGTQLLVMDASDSNALTATLNGTSMNWGTTGSIAWTAASGPNGSGGVTSMNFYGSGHGTNNIFVNAPNVDTAFSGGLATNNVLINSSSIQGLIVYGNGGFTNVAIGQDNLSSVLGWISCWDNMGGTMHISVKDSLDATPHPNVRIGSTNNGPQGGTITGLAPATILYQPGITTQLQVYGGDGGNTFTLNNPGAAQTFLSSGGADTVNLLASSATTSLTIEGSDQLDHINLGQGSLAAIQGQLTMYDGLGGKMTLSLNDSADTASHPYGALVCDGVHAYIGGLAPIAVNFDPTITTAVTIREGSGGNTFDVDTADAFPITLNTGAGNDVVNVLGTSGPVSINGGGGSDIVSIGGSATYNGTLATIQGQVSVANTGGATQLVVTDTSNSSPLTATLNRASLNWGTAGSVTWIAAGPNGSGGVTSMNLWGADGGTNTITVIAPDVITAYFGGQGTNDILFKANSVQGFIVYANGGRANVTIGQGNVSSVLGWISCWDNRGGPISLTVDDATDTSAHANVQIASTSSGEGGGSISGLAPATILYEPAVTGSLTIVGGKAVDTFTVNNPGSGVNTVLDASGAADPVHVPATTSPLYVLTTNPAEVSWSSSGCSPAPVVETVSAGVLSWVNWGSPLANEYMTLGGPSVVGLPTGREADTYSVGGSLATSFAQFLITTENDNFSAIDWTPQQGAIYEPGSLEPYQAATGSLFGPGGVPRYSDVEQSTLGDCWLLAGLAEVAVQEPEVIQSMFTYEGSAVENGATIGFYNVRFYNYYADAPFYVSVDTYLPFGGGEYDHPVNGVLWVALAEKAYAEANSLKEVPAYGTNFGQDTYEALDGGYPFWSMRAITGQTIQQYNIYSSAVFSAFQEGALVVLDTTPTGTPPNPNILDDHCYAVVAIYPTPAGESYTPAATVGAAPSSTQPFQLFNPWGTNSQGYVPRTGSESTIWGLFSANWAFLTQNFVTSDIGGATAGVAAATVPLALPGVSKVAGRSTLSTLALDAASKLPESPVAVAPVGNLTPSTSASLRSAGASQAQLVDYVFAGTMAPARYDRYDRGNASREDGSLIDAMWLDRLLDWDGSFELENRHAIRPNAS